MNINFLNKQLLVLLGIGTLLVVFVLIITLRLFFSPIESRLSPGSPTPTSVASPQENSENYQFSPLQKTNIGQTNESDIDSIFKVINKESLDTNRTKYTVESEQVGNPDEVIAQNGKVVSETTSTQVPTRRPFPSIDEFIVLFGKPEEELQGNSRYGWPINAYLYPSKGYMLLANKFTREVYEIHRFEPMSLSDYERIYNEYLLPAENEGEPFTPES